MIFTGVAFYILGAAHQSHYMPRHLPVTPGVQVVFSNGKLFMLSVELKSVTEVAKPLRLGISNEDTSCYLDLLSVKTYSLQLWMCGEVIL